MADKQIFELTQEDTPAESYRVVVQKKSERGNVRHHNWRPADQTI